MAAVRDVLVPQPIALQLDLTPGHVYDSAPRPLDDMIAAMMNASGSAARVSREEAIQVPAVQRARNEIASIATLPLVLMSGPNRLKSSFLDQLDADVSNVVTLAMTLEDLLFDAISWWKVTEVDWRGYPARVQHLDVSQVSLNPPSGATPAPLPSGEDPRGAVVWVDGKPVPARSVIRFDSPNPPLLVAGARSIRKALLLDRTAAMYADNPRPLDVFTANDAMGVDEPTDDEVVEFLSDWRAIRKRGGTGYVPPEFKRDDVSAPSPGELQLVQLQQQASLELANATGVDPEDLGVSTTSRTYFNAVDRRQSKINTVYQPYILAITQRLSMRDVTPSRQSVTVDLTNYLKPDPQARIAYYQGLVALGVSEEWILQQEGVPPEAIGEAPAAAAAPGDPAAAQNTRPKLRAVFGERAQHTFTIRPAGRHQFAADLEHRTVAGLAVPYGVATARRGMNIRFAAGSLEWNAEAPGRVKHYRDHATPIGKAITLTSKKDGLYAVLDVEEGDEGDRFLLSADHGTYDGLSIGVDYSEDPEDEDVTWDEETRTMTVLRAALREISSTAMPAFDDARMSRVTASRTGGPMHCEICGGTHAPGVACARSTPAPTATFTVPAGDPARTPAPQPGPGPQPPAGPTDQLSTYLRENVPPNADARQMENAMRAFFSGEQLRGAGDVVDPTRRFTTAVVNEPDPYRVTFSADGTRMEMARGSHDFSSDLYAYFMEGDRAAHDRALAFVQEQFDVITTNVDELNPTRQLPQRYLDQRQYRYPIWSMINKGTLSDITPFAWPKFNSASGLVAAHTEGTEPSSGTFTTTSQTVTPAGISGKAKISRETWDQGGNPQVSTLIWNKMVQNWYELLEAGAVTMLDAASPTALATFTAGGGTDKRTLTGEMEAGLAQLQFVRGGYTFDGAMAQADLYAALAAAKDTTGRPLYAMIGPANANGQTESRFGAINVAGTLFYPAWALAAAGQTAAASSYLIDSDAVDGWASAPRRLTIDNTEVANVYLGIWGYRATAINDIAGVREISYDPVA